MKPMRSILILSAVLACGWAGSGVGQEQQSPLQIFKDALKTTLPPKTVTPPGKPVVWSVTRNLFKQNIYRANALASLREKYGRESFAGREDGAYNAATDDSEVKSMTWIFDRQGHPGAAPPSGAQTVDACRQRANGQSMFTFDNILRPGHSEARGPAAATPRCRR